MFPKNVRLKNMVIKLYKNYHSEKEWKRGELTKYILQKIQEFDPKLINSKYPKDIINRYIRNTKAPILKQLHEEVKSLREEVKELRAIVQNSTK
jgi:hypothetical protein